MNVMSTYCKNLSTLELNFYEFNMYDLDSDQKEPSRMSSLLLKQRALHNLIVRGPFQFLPDVLAPLDDWSHKRKL